MDKQTAVKLIQETFESPFDKGRFIQFTKELFNHIEVAPFIYRGNTIPDAFDPYIKTLERVGKYADPGGHKIDVLIAHLKKETSLERARTMQRNFIAWYLDGSRGGIHKDAAVVAFVSPEREDWRFSIVKMEYSLTKTDGGKIKPQKELTPARRLSFLVGKNENSHTAQKQLLPLLENDEYNPHLSDFEEAFNIETVTKEFFKKYRDLFLWVEESLTGIVKKDAAIAKDFSAKGVGTVNFSKKLLGQIVFLYFLQKKGWFGVKRGKDWGGGSKHFLRELFKKEHGGYTNFFNDILEPLFYEALRLERPADYYSRFDCRIPFLNGGLFDPINDYNWQDTDILLPNDLFSNSVTTKDGDKGTGILDVFDRYNFTVKEDEPLEKEVAIDPEMLGKVFENLLEVKDRKSKGTYYTPREIVHYMCQESLINYLHTELNPPGEKKADEEPETEQKKLFGEPDAKQMKLPVHSEMAQDEIQKEDIAALIHHGESAIEHDAVFMEKQSEGENGKGRYAESRLPESIVKNAKLIDEKLASVRVCDPAVGSGAFLVGMMNEIVRARNALTNYLSLRGADVGARHVVPPQRAVYQFKRHAIQNCLYGVDIDAGATEIAKLRLWLSLVVDEDDIKQIKPLPNLDYKIVCGNSLLGVERSLENWEAYQKLESLKPLHFNETSAGKKQKYKEQIDKLIQELTHNETKFDFYIYFSEVFHEKKGFDVVIANPPYLRIQEIQQNDPVLAEKLKKHYCSASGSYDIYVCFVELATRKISHKGNIAYILPHKFFQAAFGKDLRKLISSKKLLRKIVDFGSSQIFESATTYTCLLFLSTENKAFTFAELKPSATKDDLVGVFDAIDGKTSSHSEKVNIAVIPNDAVTEKEWHFSAGSEGKLLSKLKEHPRTLSDVCEKIFQGIATSADRVYFLEHISENKGIVRAFSKSLDNEISIEKEFVKPMIKGADVHRYSKLKPKIWCIFPYELKDGKPRLYTQKEIKDMFPLAWKYLLENKKELENREHGRFKADWWCFSRPQNLTEFEKPKIMTPEISLGCNLTFDSEGLYHNTKCYSFVFKNNMSESTLFYLSILNSKLLWYFLTTTGYVLRGGYFTFKTNYLLPFPLPAEATKAEQKPFIELVDKILAITKDDDYLTNASKQDKVRAHEREIDELVYKLYELTPEEIKIVEGNYAQKSGEMFV